jgi:DNA topoisomerase-1
MKHFLNDKGIYKKNGNYYFFKNNIKVLDLNILERLNKYRVPPAWKSVWYASDKKSHIQIHGIDSSGKKQYILSDKWINNKRTEKFNRINYFVKDLNSFRNKIRLDKNDDSYSKCFLIKLLFNLLLDLHLRIGNEKYATSNKTYGLTTLRQKHLIIKNGELILSFIGKSNIHHNIDIPSEYSTIIKKFIIPNKPNYPLFYYYNYSNNDSNNNKTMKLKSITSEELNNYLKDHMGKDYTCKDFRTYSANILFIKEFLKKSKSIQFIPDGSRNNIKKLILTCIDNSAKQLGHSRSICKKSYISDNLLNYCVDSFSDAAGSSFSSLVSKIVPTAGSETP